MSYCGSEQRLYVIVFKSLVLLRSSHSQKNGCELLRRPLKTKDPLPGVSLAFCLLSCSSRKKYRALLADARRIVLTNVPPRLMYRTDLTSMTFPLLLCFLCRSCECEYEYEQNYFGSIWLELSPTKFETWNPLKNSSDLRLEILPSFCCIMVSRIYMYVHKHNIIFAYSLTGLTCAVLSNQILWLAWPPVIGLCSGFKAGRIKAQAQFPSDDWPDATPSANRQSSEWSSRYSVSSVAPSYSSASCKLVWIWKFSCCDVCKCCEEWR